MRAFGELLLSAAKTLIDVARKVGYQGKLDNLMNIFSKDLKMSILYIIHAVRSLKAIDPFAAKSNLNAPKALSMNV